MSMVNKRKRTKRGTEMVHEDERSPAEEQCETTSYLLVVAVVVFYVVGVRRCGRWRWKWIEVSEAFSKYREKFYLYVALKLLSLYGVGCLNKLW